MAAMKHKVSELEGALLDAAVAKAEGRWSADAIQAITEHPGVWRPSLNWAFGGPIIERERIELASPGSHRHPGQWAAWTCVDDHEFYGATPLIAAMRAYVASKFGDAVDLP